MAALHGRLFVSLFMWRYLAGDLRPKHVFIGVDITALLPRDRYVMESARGRCTAIDLAVGSRGMLTVIIDD